MQSSSFQKKINPGKAPEKISVFSEPTELALQEWQLKDQREHNKNINKLIYAVFL